MYELPKYPPPKFPCRGGHSSSPWGIDPHRDKDLLYSSLEEEDVNLHSYRTSVRERSASALIELKNMDETAIQVVLEEIKDAEEFLKAVKQAWEEEPQNRERS
ncbi:hypothetical protein COLO4_31182 [Corchorus olitorius]|uniref:Uncharacterized protein n=1 Tax=Corchorus olitorius TaxID=93759 RepID=A0A1R3H5A4_9ROSI|nr:hypothetical protein COLO4_31182 [Corchorus olitorius]